MAKKKGIELNNITSDHPSQYLQYRAQHLKPRAGDFTALCHLIDFLRRESVIPEKQIEVQPLLPIEQCTLGYENYLRDTRNLAKATIINYVPFIRCFLKYCFTGDSFRLSELCARNVIKFVQHQASRLHMKRAKLMTTALRSFLTYIRYLGEIELDLAAAVPIVANWSMPSIPRAISAEQVHQLLESIDQHTAIGRRDYAVLLLLARLGLRSSEIVGLELNDIDWNTGTVSVRSKGGIHNEFPLSHEVGNAIAAYLEDGRPLCTCPRLFLRAKAPNVGFLGPCGVGSIVYHSLKRAGINAPTNGAHQFRHGLACQMLKQGASLGEIGDVLGHRHPQTTKIYIKVDIDALRRLAIPWPGGVQ